MNKNAITRRHFIRKQMAAALAAAALPTIIPARALGKEGATAPSERIVVAGIGVGPQGRYDMSGFLSQRDCQVVAVCDVAKRNLDQALTQVNQKYGTKDCAAFTDYRELLARKDIDAVLIATPDHWHVPVAIAAAKAGKDLYLEKPMGLSIAEDQLLRKLVQKNKRIFQFGTQQRSSIEFYRACALARSGRLGKIQQINVWCAASQPGGTTAPAPVPEGLNYDFWLGPAPSTPYTVDKCFDSPGPGLWKTWWFNYDYALGFIAGWGVHPLDIALWGYPQMMDGPLTVEGKAIIPSEGACNTSVAWDVNFTFADGVRMQYKGMPNGFKAHALNDFSDWKKKYGNIADHGTVFEGTDGWVLVHRGGLRTYPERLAEEKIEESSVPLIRSSHHARNFLDSVKKRQPAICPIEDAVQADILCHLSDIASRVGRKLTWDPKKEQFVKDKEANAKTELRPMRQPWRLS